MKPAQKQNEYFISHLGEHVGPWGLDEIAQRLAKVQLLATDFIYDDQAADWIALNKYQPLLDLISTEFKPTKAPPTAVIKQPEVQAEHPAQAKQAEVIQMRPSAQEAWFVQKESHRFGPLTSLNVVKALQEKTVFDFEFIWQEGMTDWVRIAEHPAFTIDKIRTLATEQKDIFIARKHPRITFMNEVMVHDHHSLWMGQAFQGSEGGSGLIIQNAALHLGQIVNLHFASHDGLNAFNVSGEIVCKKFVKDIKNKKTPVPYGVKFVDLESKLQNMLRDYFTHKAQPEWMFAGK
jgi:hypothetical protein